MTWIASPLAVPLLQWTLLLGLAWATHVLLCRRHPRWRLILWRGVFVLGLLLPLARLVPAPRLELALPPAAAPSALQTPAPAAPVFTPPTSAAPTMPVDRAEKVDTAPAPLAASHPTAEPVRRNWAPWLGLLWFAGAVWAGLRFAETPAPLAPRAPANDPRG